MAAPALGDLIQVTTVASLCGQTCLNTFWYRLQQVGPLSSQALMADRLNTAFTAVGGLGSTLALCYPANATMQEIWYQTVFPIRAQKQVRGWNITGGDDVAAFTANNAAVITRRGEEANRHNIGSLHIPIAVTDSNASDGVLLTTSPLWTSLGLVAGLIPSSIETADPAPAIFRPVLVDTQGQIPIQYVPITNATRRGTVRVMRRRTVGVGI